MKKLLLLLSTCLGILGCEMDRSDLHDHMNDRRYEIRIGTAIDTSRGTVSVRLTDEFCEVKYYRFSDTSYVVKNVPSVPNIVSVIAIK